MKKFLFYILPIFIFTACTTDDNSDEPGIVNPPPSIIIDNNDIIINTEETSGKLSFEINADWTINTVFSNNDEWFKVSPTSGKAGKISVSVNTQKNETYSDRNGIIKIKSGSSTATVNITQKKKDAIIASKDKVILTEKDEVFEIEIQSNIDYQVLIPEEFQSWISKTTAPKLRGLTTQKEYFKVQPPTEDGGREGYINFQNGNIVETVQIYQAQKDILVLTSTPHLIGNEGLDLYKIDLRTNIEYQITIPDKDKSWISVNTPKNRAIRNDIIYFKIEENKTSKSRTTDIVIKDVNSNLSQTVKVTQSDNAFFILGQNPYDVKYDGLEKLEVEMKTIVEGYDVIIPDEDKEWISLSEIVKEKNNQPDRLYFKIKENDTYSKRSVNIKIQDKNSTANIILTINQDQNEAIILTQREIMIGENGGTFDVEIQGNVNFEIIMPEASWLEQVPQTRGLESSKKRFRVNEPFAGLYNRTAEIKFKDVGSDIEDVVTIIQTSSAYGIYTNRDMADFNLELSKESKLQKKAILSKFGQFNEKTNKWNYRLMQDVHATYYSGSWKQINEFSDTFDGQNHTITKLEIRTVTNRGYHGLFSKVTKGGKVKDLTIKEMYCLDFGKSSRKGGICGYLDSDSEIINCTVGAFTGSGSDDSGGIVGINYGKVIDCTKKDMADVYGSFYDIAGGIAAVNYGSIINCKNESKMRLYFSDQGGICGINYGEIISCTNEGNFTINAEIISSNTPHDFGKGGICGKSEGGSIIACINRGDIYMRYHSNGSGYFGGICGKMNNTGGVIISCISSADITTQASYLAKGDIGGICGNMTESNYSVANYYTGQLTGTDYIGGIAGVGRPNEFQIASNFWLEGKGANKRFGNITNTGSSDIIGRKTVEEMQSASSSLNQAINAWNQQNPNRKCNYQFYNSAGEYPTVRKK